MCPRCPLCRADVVTVHAIKGADSAHDPEDAADDEDDMEDEDEARE